MHVRHVDAGSDGSEEWEIQALLGPVYDLHRLGVFITASPRHADVLLVTGAGARGMTGPLRTTYDAMPDPKVVIATGTDAVSGGLLAGSEAVTDGVGATVPVDIWLAGSPPSPFGILNALLIAVGYLTPDGGGRDELGIRRGTDPAGGGRGGGLPRRPLDAVRAAVPASARPGPAAWPRPAGSR